MSPERFLVLKISFMKKMSEAATGGVLKNVAKHRKTPVPESLFK